MSVNPALSEIVTPRHPVPPAHPVPQLLEEPPPTPSALVPFPPPLPPPLPGRTLPAPPPSAQRSLVAEPVSPPSNAAEAAASAVELREDREHLHLAIIAGGVSMIVHLVILITLGLMLAVSRPEGFTGVQLEASVASLDEAQEAARSSIELTKPTNESAARPPRGSPNMDGALSRLPGLGGGERVGIEIGPPRIAGASGGPLGGDGLGHDGAKGSDVDDPSGSGHGATFFNVQALGRKIAFVVDTSGSMFDNDRYLRCRAELIESLRSLKPKQYYFVVLFSDRLFPMPGRRLTEATSGNLYRTIAWLNGSTPVGTTEPISGLKLALQQRPDAIFLLTDGSFEDGTLEKILALQTGSKKVPIHTIAFENEEGEQTLRRISRATGGKYRFVP